MLRKSQQTFQKHLNLEALHSGVKSGGRDREDDAAKSLWFPLDEAAKMVANEVGQTGVEAHFSTPITSKDDRVYCSRHNYNLHNSPCANSVNSQRNGASSR